MRLDIHRSERGSFVTVPQPSNPVRASARGGMPAQREPVADRRTRRCRRCRALLRRTNYEDLCGPCERVAAVAKPVLSASFYEQPDVVEALTNHDFGRFFRLARADLGVTQEQFGLLIGLAQSRVCKIENGGSLRNIETVVRLASTFGIPSDLLGFAGDAGTVDGDDGTRAVSWLQRRDFAAAVAATALGVGATGRLPETAGEAEPWLRRAVAGRGPQYARSRTLNLIALSATYFQHGDGLEEGVRVGDEALAGASALNSPRARSRLRGLDRVTAFHAQAPGVAEFRDRLRLALADAAG